MYTDLGRHRVRVSDKVIEKASRLFDASLSDILKELLQNARRAGASTVTLTTFTQDGYEWLAVEDDGTGMFVNSAEIVFGESSWCEKTRVAEDPAGMGIFSLGHRGAVFEACGLRVALSPSQFAGQDDYRITQSTRSAGTKVAFPITYKERSETEAVTRECAKYYPVPVAFNGTPMSRREFLGVEVVYRESWNGLEIGIVHSSGCKSEINFYGLVVKSSDLPFLRTEGTSTKLGVRINVVDAPELKLVLPTRKEVHHDEFFERLQTACYEALYRYVATLTGHSLAYKDWQMAKQLGIDLPEAEAKLRPYAFSKAYDQDWPFDKPTDCRAGAIVTTALDSVEARAIERGMSQREGGVSLYKLNEAFAGYSWYEALPEYQEFEVLALVDGEYLSVSDTYSQGVTRPNRIIVRGILEYSDGRTDIDEFDTDIALYKDESIYWGNDLEGATVLVAQNSTISEPALVEELTWAFFHPSDGYDADSVDTQLQSFEDDAYALATSLLRSEEDALREQIYGLIERYVLRIVPEDRRINVVVKGRERSIDVAIAVADE